MVFTSGTTGEPKGVMHTQNTTLSTLHRAIERLELSDRDVILMASTLGHQTGLSLRLLPQPAAGRHHGVDGRLERGEAARLIEAEGVTVSMGATPFLRDLTYAGDRREPALAPPVHRGGGADPATLWSGTPVSGSAA